MVGHLRLHGRPATNYGRRTESRRTARGTTPRFRFSPVLLVQPSRPRRTGTVPGRQREYDRNRPRSPSPNARCHWGSSGRIRFSDQGLVLHEFRERTTWYPTGSGRRTTARAIRLGQPQRARRRTAHRQTTIWAIGSRRRPRRTRGEPSRPGGSCVVRSRWSCRCPTPRFSRGLAGGPKARRQGRRLEPVVGCDHEHPLGACFNGLSRSGSAEGPPPNRTP